MDRWRFSATVLLPSMLALIITGAAVMAFVLWSTANLDQRAQERQARIAARILENNRVELAHEQESIALSDDAFRHIRQAYDPGWVSDHVGRWMNEFFDHANTVILNERDQPLFVATGGVTDTNESFEEHLLPGLAPMLAQLRQRIAGGAIERYRLDDSSPAPWVSEYALVDGKPAIVAISPIMGEGAVLAGAPDSIYLIVSLDYLDDQLAERITSKYLIDDASFVMRPSTSETRLGRPIVDSRGRFIAFFEWTRNRPGQMMLRSTGPVLAAGFIVSAILVILLMTQLRRSSAAVEAARRAAEHQAAHDRLTGLPNRSGFDAHLARLLEAGNSSGSAIHLLMLDLDRFKQVNDTLGHQAGDDLIEDAAQRIRQVVPGDVFVARIGGDEFALVAATAHGHLDPLHLAQDLVKAIGQPFAIGQYHAHVGASIGIASTRAGELDAKELVRKADIALYEAKAAGRNRATVFEEHMNELLQLQHTIEAELREALETREHLSIGYQPLVDQKSRRVVGAEALARWNHPKYGQISPARFIPIAETSGLIGRLGEHVLRRACELGATAPGYTMAVNISPMQLRSPDFATRVFDILHETGMRTEDLELEITESILLDDEHISSQNLLTFRAAGIHIALDDFGTGYSSLSYLKRYPVDRIKIDRSFVSQLATGHVSVAITQALVTLAHAMNIHVTAEGVETAEQARILGELGCNTLQGFLFSGAVDEATIRAVFDQPDNLPQRRRRPGRVA
ncbi:EAL domain-containing protein [Devosia sp. PTR5]|uniref:EAL domain-containing protein n=1 Tax=Devosia oryzisoli TaxID=2774138 RepID=A0A927FSK3_9HYPH|nr:EAL domain-containing protein [Devosia oryzisoli]MBD8063909.1 EAL domain-containing protein [Devosia oryzisoli]